MQLQVLHNQWAMPRNNHTGGGCKILSVQSSLEKLANSPNASWEKSGKISVCPGITCVCNVMMNGRMVVNSDRPEISTRNQFKPWKNSNLWDFILSRKAWNLHPSPCVDIKWNSPTVLERRNLLFCEEQLFTNMNHPLQCKLYKHDAEYLR